MTSTEQKNVTQHFVSHCFTFGIVPTIKCRAFANFAIDTDRLPFTGIGPTSNLQTRIENAEDPIAESRSLLPILDTAPLITRSAPLLLWITRNASVVYGNQAVFGFLSAYYDGAHGLTMHETKAVKHARRHTGYIHAMLAPASYSRIERAARNATNLIYRKRSEKYRSASDNVEVLSKSGTSGKYSRRLRKWCVGVRKLTGIRSRYTKYGTAHADYEAIDEKVLSSIPYAPSLEGTGIRCSKAKRSKIHIYKQGGLTYIRIATEKSVYTTTATGIEGERTAIDEGKQVYYHRVEKDATVYVFNNRDLDDLRYLLHAGALYHAYVHRREYGVNGESRKSAFKKLSDSLWRLYLSVADRCGTHFSDRNKCGVYFDVLQWRYLAWRSGNEFYDHSAIMQKKLETKGLTAFPSQEGVLRMLTDVEMDISIDLLGVYKASIYPEVDPFQVVTDQYALHYSRHNTEWEQGSAEEERFELTRSYMWYLGIRVLKGVLKYWPGRIREGVEDKPWHKDYLAHGVPGDRWREACDVDLTGCYPQSDISDEQYMRQADSACAPPDPFAYRSFMDMRQAPRRHKRKILYAIQEPHLPDLRNSLQHLNELGEDLPRGYVGKVPHSFPFSVDIVTGSRCERHKEAPRPFYAASSPWGCILSYLDGITRDFLAHVPQSLLGKSTRQKYLDISTAGEQPTGLHKFFFVSDDKAKYSPRMDPQSQQLPSEFFAEIFGIPGFKAYGPVMYHCDLYYRVCGHLVKYGSNGTDREGMRGASNTWLEIVAQGLATRLSREKGLTTGKSVFLSFIDDGLRRFAIPTIGRDDEQVKSVAREVLDEVIFGLKVLGRELSWDKTFVSSDMYVILNEIMYDGSHFSSGLKSYVTVGDMALKEVMTAADYEQLYFGKLKGALSVGADLDLCHITYIYETLMSHYKMGLRLQDNKNINAIDYRLFCITPIALGGSGIRSMMQMGCTENANATKEGIGNISRLCQNCGVLKHCLTRLLTQPLELIKPVDFMREPEQIHIAGPRIRTQRVAAVVRHRLSSTACNPMSRAYMDQDREGMHTLAAMGTLMMATGDVSAAEVRLLYSMTPVAFIDEFIQKLASSATISQLLPPETIASLRKNARLDLVMAANVYGIRCGSAELLKALRSDPELWVVVQKWFV